MKSTGIIRQVDKMGRVVIPKEIRAQLNIKNDEDSFEIFLEGDKVILQKYHPTCFFCDSLTDVITYNDYLICKECVEKMHSMLDSAE
ncbi:MAG: AbrB/MazE/SpoVT family DNA-binding domain-containing protein [Clostridia bacterium]|nr:AbrB/MazE/SpoVT family DNA-binding domain-containing protein [Clostridia bacterium]